MPDQAIAPKPISVDPLLVSPTPLPNPKRKRSMLPVLVVLFLFSWGLMASLIMEQGRTIQSQRGLIQSLFQDSSQLSHMKGEAFQKQRAAAQAQAAAAAHSQVQTPSTQDKTQNQASQNQAKSQSSGKLRKRVPFQPPTDAVTMADERRTVMII
jgi:hypothetical protein